MPDRHSASWANPCWICGWVNSHDHTTAEWIAAEWAVAAERARIRAAVLSAGMFEGCGGMGCTEERNDELAAVLRIIAKAL